MSTIILSVINYFLIGSFLGFSAGISPGPLITLVITKTITHNKWEGIKVAFSPLISDLPIIIITYFILQKLSGFDLVLAIISIAGGIYIAYLGYESIKTRELNAVNQAPKSNSFAIGFTANIISPHPYLFWATIGIPYAIKAQEINTMATVLFFFAFYLFLVGSKIVVALIVSRSKKSLNPKFYKTILRVLGVALLLFSIMLIYDGIQFMLSNESTFKYRN